MKKYTTPYISIEEVMPLVMFAASGDPDVKFDPDDETTDNDVKPIFFGFDFD